MFVLNTNSCGLSWLIIERTEVPGSALASRLSLKLLPNEHFSNNDLIVRLNLLRRKIVLILHDV